MRVLYNLLTWIMLLPFGGMWVFRGFTNRAYWNKLGQRFGRGYPQLKNSIWVHAVSVGEVQAAVPLIRALQQQYPERPLLISTVTPTGAARVEALFGATVQHCYIPFEIPPAVNAFYASVQPGIAMIMETEIWPNLYRGCGVREIPLVLVSARISPRSLPGYRRLLPLFRETLSHGIVIAAQSQADADRFMSLGASEARTRVTGNIKFDIQLDADLNAKGAQLRRELFAARPVWVAASTHDGEEAIVLDAHCRLREQYPDLLLILVPRHPERFAPVKEMIAKIELPFVARTDDKPCDPSTAVFVGDTLGELPLFYAASDIAFVAGSLVPVGGHNLLEPAALAKPVITGPHVFNAQQIANMFVAEKACLFASDARELVQLIQQLLADPERAERMGRNAQAIVAANRGALHRLLQLVEPLLGDSS